MLTFRNKNYTKRNYECTNVICCQAEKKPETGDWQQCEDHEIKGLTQLFIQAGVRYFGYL